MADGRSPSRLLAALAERYHLERELGQGGMATVYLAERFFREIEVAGKLRHPHILLLHDSGEAQGFLYYVMPFVDGQSRLVYSSEILPDGKYLIYSVPVAGGRAREVAHSEGPTYQNFRFTFNLRGDTLYFVLADRQSDLWMADMQRR